MGFRLAPIPLTLDGPSSWSLRLSNISITVYGMQQHWADTRSIERISCYMNRHMPANDVDYNVCSEREVAAYFVLPPKTIGKHTSWDSTLVASLV